MYMTISTQCLEYIIIKIPNLSLCLKYWIRILLCRDTLYTHIIILLLILDIHWCSKMYYVFLTVHTYLTYLHLILLIYLIQHIKCFQYIHHSTHLPISSFYNPFFELFSNIHLNLCLCIT